MKISLITAERSRLEEVGVSAAASLAAAPEDVLAGRGCDDCLSEPPDAIGDGRHLEGGGSPEKRLAPVTLVT